MSTALCTNHCSSAFGERGHEHFITTGVRMAPWTGASHPHPAPHPPAHPSPGPLTPGQTKQEVDLSNILMILSSFSCICNPYPSSVRDFHCTKRGKHHKEAPPAAATVPPTPPKPFYLHLRITGEVADIRQFPDELTGFDIPLSAITADSGT